MPNRKFQTNSKKIQKIRTIPFWLHLKKKYVETCPKREKIKIIVPFHSIPTRHVIENSKKNRKKKFKKFKNSIVASFHAIINWNRPRNKENKNYHSVSFQLDT